MVEVEVGFGIGIEGVKLGGRGVVFGMVSWSLDPGLDSCLGFESDLDLGRRARQGCRMWRSRGIPGRSGGIPCVVGEGM